MDLALQSLAAASSSSLIRWWGEVPGGRALREEPAPLSARPRVPGALLQEFFILLFSRPRCVCAPLHMYPFI